MVINDMNSPPRRILVIYRNPDPPEKTRLTILHHLRVMEYCEVNHDIHYFNTDEIVKNTLSGSRKRNGLRPTSVDDHFDAIILHYSFLSLVYYGLAFYQFKDQFNWIRDLNAIKIAIPQDEGDYTGLRDEWLFELDVSVIFSVHYRSDGPLYPIMRNCASIYSCLPGYIDDSVAKYYVDRLLPMKKRQYDIIYRARRLTHRYGTAGRNKYLIADVIKEYVKDMNLKTNISTNPDDVISGNAWLDFLASSRAILGTEGGYSVIDWRGEESAQINLLMKQNTELSYNEVKESKPKGWDNNKLLTITPRHFESIITKTCQILLEGDYKGILSPDYHYISLRQDFSNLDELLEKVRDHQYLQKIADQAYNDIYLGGNYTYRKFAEKIERIMEKHLYLGKNGMKIKQKTEEESNTIAALERQLIAERHQNALIIASLPKIADELAMQMTRRIWEQLKIKVKGKIIIVLPIVILILLGIGFALIAFFKAL